MGELTLRPAAGVVLRDGTGRVLLMRRRGERTWGIPGGGLEPGESLVDAAVRECLEETGWSMHIDGLLGIYSDPSTQVHRYPNGALRHFVGVVFIATAQTRLRAPGEETVNLAWVTPGELPASLFGPDVPVLRDAFDPSRKGPVID